MCFYETGSACRRCEEVTGSLVFTDRCVLLPMTAFDCVFSSKSIVIAICSTFLLYSNVLLQMATRGCLLRLSASAPRSTSGPCTRAHGARISLLSESDGRTLPIPAKQRYVHRKEGDHPGALHV